MYQSNRSFNFPPGHTPGIWRLFLAGREGIWSPLASILCYESRWFPGDGGDKLWWIQKEKIACSWRSGWKPKPYTSFVPYLKVFKDDLYLIFFKEMARGMQLRVSEYWNSNLVIFPGVGAFEQLFGLGRGDFEQKFSKNSNARGVARGVVRGDVEASIWLVHNGQFL